MPAIAESDDLYAWLIRGFVEAGVPDHTRGGREWTAAGALNLENFIQEQGAGGIVLEFRGQAGDEPSPEDEYTYSVSVVRSPEGTQVVVRCPETLFHHAFPNEPREALAAHILGQLRQHNEAFTEWRAKGGETTYAQRIGIPAARGSTCDRALVTVLETLRRSNRSVVEGPANKWWVKAAGPAGSNKIEAGLGQEPVYASKKSTSVKISPEEIAHAARLRGAGMLLLLSGFASLGVLVLATAFAGYNVYRVGVSGVLAQPYLVASLLTTFLFAVVHIVAGWRMRALRNRRFVQVLTVFGMLPCLAPCCGLGIPAGAWVLYLLQDERSSKVFNE